MYKVFKICALLGIAFSICSSYASDKGKDLSSIKQQLQASFSSIHVNAFKTGPITGSYEINMGNGIIYYFPKDDLIVFGEVFNKSGESLTKKSMQSYLKEKMKSLPIDSGLIIGDASGTELIEITDPNCPYCQKYEEFIEELSEKQKIKRVVFFETRIHAGSKEKALHVLCSEDKTRALKTVFTSQPKELISCKAGEEQLAKQQAVINALGVSATPTLVIDYRLQPGFRPSVVEDFIKSTTKEGETNEKTND